MRRPSGWHRRPHRRRLPALRIRPQIWAELLTGLHERGDDQRESGAFLLAARDASSRRPPKIVAIAYYDDLDARCLTGGISLSGSAYDLLWRRCREEGLRVVADVHTHPGAGVRQSHIDRANPMMAHAGHLALIVSHYARSSPEAAIGLYRYVGAHEWETLAAREHLDVGEHLPAWLHPRSWRNRG